MGIVSPLISVPCTEEEKDTRHFFLIIAEIFRTHNHFGCLNIIFPCYFLCDLPYKICGFRIIYCGRNVPGIFVICGALERPCYAVNNVSYLLLDIILDLRIEVAARTEQL